MSTGKAGLLDGAVSDLDRVIKRAHEEGYGESVQFLMMARTQLLIDIHGITDVEFRAFCDWLEQPPQARGPAPQPRVRRDGQMRGMRRAWLCPQDAAALRRTARAGR
jgi:hypothetical protein